MTEQDHIRRYKKDIVKLQQRISAESLVNQRLVNLLKLCHKQEPNGLLKDMIGTELESLNYQYKVR